MLYCSGTDIDALTAAMDLNLEAANQWALTWAMKFNPAKTEAMFISRNATPKTIHFSGHAIPFVPTHKHLGFVLSNDLSYSPHVDAVCRKTASQIFLLKRLASNTRNQATLT